MVKAGALKYVRAPALGINRKNIYKVNKQAIKDEQLKALIIQTHEKHPAYGHLRMAWELGINHKRTQRVMKKFGLKPPRRRRKYFCTRSRDHHTYTNLIHGWSPTRPNELWCSDVSYLKFQGRFWYLATIEDIFTRQVVASQVSKHHDRWLVLSTIKQALQNTRSIPTFFHTDQGTEFMAKACTHFLEEKGIQVSVSKKASPWQNGFQESFFGTFKAEFGDFNRFETVGELIEELYGQVHYYNYERRHTALKVAPAVFAASFSDNRLPVWGYLTKGDC